MGRVPLALALELRDASCKFKSCLAPRQAEGRLFSFWDSGKMASVPVQPTDRLWEALWVKGLLPDLGREVTRKAVLALFSQG